MEADPLAAHREPQRARLIAAGVALALTATLSAGIGTAVIRPGRLPAAPGAVAVLEPRAPDRKAVAAMLANRTRAVRDHDRAAFLATVASAPPIYQAAQAQLFDNLAALPLESWQEELAVGQPSAGPVVRVTVRYRLRGFDHGTVARTRYLWVARRSGGSTVIGDGTAQGLTDDTEIWDGGPLTVIRGRSSLVIGNSTGAAELKEIAGRLDAAVPIVTGVVGREWDRRAVALVPADALQAQALVGQGQNLQAIAALATITPAGQETAAGGRPRGEDRIVISPETFGRLNALGRGVVLTHELTHVATGGARDTRTPIWLIEGLADYVGYKSVKIGVRSAAQELRDEVLAGRPPDRLPGREAFGGSSPGVSQAYEEAWLACRMVADRYGQPELMRLYRAAGRMPEPAALRSVLGVTPAGFTDLWRGYLIKELV